MKEKRLLAMFVTSAVTLVASLAITFGVFLTLADPVVATGLTTYSFNFNAEVDQSFISVDGSSMTFKNKVVFQPTASADWSETDLVWVNTNEDNKVWYADETVSSKVKVLPIHLENNYNKMIELSLTVDIDRTSVLGQYTFAKLFSYDQTAYLLDFQPNGYTIFLNPHVKADFLVVVYADESTNTGVQGINWGTDLEEIGVTIVNNTVPSELV